ncbi:MAG: glycosyl hydrolase 115 family protein [Lachnospiraceae bacterium]|nr:glycosyl hydrolase 115 family protein [Lachnospiraceae bacterium]
MGFRFGKNLNRIALENNNLNGVARIAKVFAKDIESVFGGKAEIAEVTPNDTLLENDIIVKTDPTKFDGEYQCYEIHIEGNILWITGSDLLGTIYGMFHVSEMIGVTPLVYFGDIEPLRRKELALKDYHFRSKQPSVKYRGFFINDEWPCFGTWITSKFGGANALCYEVIFEFLLRMKGNFLWPAMWASSFPCDGPGTLNEELATELGITVSYSHHEPCLRASEEWKTVCGEGSPYGSVWNFDKNEQGLLNYWRDSLKRSGRFNHIITIGMRGEYDSVMLENATLEDNINALKKIILAQKALIKELGIKLPLTLAVYKEVEQYFYGDENTPGLKYWDELDDVILMLCEDNQGHMRGLPTKDMRDHKGGYGMYFHLDYHGGPVSFEWVNSTSFHQVWEEMTEAYDFGIKDIWVVNVGDIKFNEIPLYYFMQIAYDYEKWGSGNLESPMEFTDFVTDTFFPTETPSVKKEIGRLLTDAYQLNSQKRPEAVHSGSYALCANFENDRMINFVEELEDRAIKLNKKLKPEYKNGFYSSIYWPVLASTNLYLMWLYSDKNNFYAKQGKSAANHYGKLAAERIVRDRALADEFDKFKKGKWHGMQLEAHVGFTTWTDFDNRMPIVSDFTPVEKPLLKVSFADREEVFVKIYGRPMRMDVVKTPSFVEISNCGNGKIAYTIVEKTDDGEKEVLKDQTALTDLYKLIRAASDEKDHLYVIKGSDGTVIEMMSHGFGIDFVKTDRKVFGNIRDFEREGAINLKASDNTQLIPGTTGQFTLLKGYGKYEEGLKVLGRVDDYGKGEKASKAVWEFDSEYEGKLHIELITAPTNPLKYHGALNVSVSLNGERSKKLNLVPEDFMAGENSDARWCRDVVAMERRTFFEGNIVKGRNKIEIGAVEMGVIIERIIIYGTEDAYRRSIEG